MTTASIPPLTVFGQHAAVIDFMRRAGSINPFQAIPQGITRLSARIYELRRKGFVIESGRVWAIAPDGAPRYVAQYWLKPQAQLGLFEGQP